LIDERHVKEDYKGLRGDMSIFFLNREINSTHLPRRLSTQILWRPAGGTAKLLICENDC
jgi:hypothetical protein